MKNYTSRMPVSESVEKIISALKGIGAIAGEHGQWVKGSTTNPSAVTCCIPMSNGAGVFKFAPDVSAVLDTLKGSDEKKKAQAEITAWRSMYDFIEIQSL
jgi:hypothetical protein